MQQLITKSYNGFLIEFELMDGQLMANATAMCAAFGKRPVDWLRTAQAGRYIKALEAKCEFPTLVDTRQGGNESGTWIHERLILKLAQWLNVDFELQCDEWVAELLRTGSVALAPLSPAELILQQAQQMVNHERRMNQLEAQQQADRQHLATIEEKVAQVQAKITTVDSDFYTVAGWASLHKKPIPSSEANKLGRKAAALSKNQNIPIGKVSDARYGAVNTYHRTVLGQII